MSRWDAWPPSASELAELQHRLAAAWTPGWRPPQGRLSVAGCFICFPRGEQGPGGPGDPAWAGAASVTGRRTTATSAVGGRTAAGYEPGLLALREGPLLEAAVRGLPARPQLLVVNATGRDHPRRAGLALHLGAVLGLPSIGVTHRPLLGAGEWPPDAYGAASPLLLGDEVVGYWLRTRAGRRPVAVHAAWQTDAATARDVAAALVGRRRTPEPIRAARRVARSRRSAAEAEPGEERAFRA